MFAKIILEPSTALLIILLKEIRANTSSVQSNHGGDDDGHLGMICLIFIKLWYQIVSCTYNLTIIQDIYNSDSAWFNMRLPKQETNMQKKC